MDVLRRTRLVLVGAGRRARRTLLPAIHCCASTVDLVAVCTRSPRDLALLGGRLRIGTRRLADLDLSDVDAVVVAVPTSEVASVVAEIARRPQPGPTLMLDTPGLAPGDLKTIELFGRFRAVLASEDHIALPLYVLARRLLDEGAIGALRSAYLLHSGYRHHAIAALKRLTGARHPRSVAIERWNAASSEIRVSFPHGVRGIVVEPRNYVTGRTTIVGSTGLIVDYPIEHPRTIRIGYRVVEGRYLGLTLDEEPVPGTHLDASFANGLEGATLEDPSVMNQMKIRACMELIVALPDPNSTFRYSVLDAIADDLVVRFAQRAPFPIPGSPRLLRAAARIAAGRMSTDGDDTD